MKKTDQLESCKVRHMVLWWWKELTAKSTKCHVPCCFQLSTRFFFCFFVFFFLGSREASYLPNLVGLSNSHFLAFVWLDKVRRPRKSCEGAEAGDVWHARPTPECARRSRGHLSAGSRVAERAGAVRTKHTQESGGYQRQSMVQTRPAPRLFPAASPWDSTPQTR